MVEWIKRIICIFFIVWFGALLFALPAMFLLPTLGMKEGYVRICVAILALMTPITGVWLYVRTWKKTDARPSSEPKRSELSMRNGLFTALALLVGVPFAYFRFKDTTEEMTRQQQPGHDAFRKADLLLTGRSEGTAHGNTPEAQALAAEFSLYLKQARKLGIESRKSTSIISLTGGEFLTYCSLTQDNCVFMVHVPDLRNFSREAKDYIADSAWFSALAVTEPRQAALKSVCVGVRGVLMYDRVISGQPGSPARASLLRRIEVDGDDECQEFLQGYFAPRPPAATQTTPVPPTVK
jgi:hypothetical protein